LKTTLIDKSSIRLDIDNCEALIDDGIDIPNISVATDY